VLLAFWHGLRVSEACHLNLNQVDFESDSSIGRAAARHLPGTGFLAAFLVVAGKGKV
jgi:integrase